MKIFKRSESSAIGISSHPINAVYHRSIEYLFTKIGGDLLCPDPITIRTHPIWILETTKILKPTYDISYKLMIDHEKYRNIRFFIFAKK